MTPDSIEKYGWISDEAPHSCNYLVPEAVEILSGLNVRRVLDIGSGNGKLVSVLTDLGYEAVGVENDKGGVEISKSNYPGASFYNYGVQDMPSELLHLEDAFDAVVSTEVIEHLYAPEMLLKYANSVLRDKGYLVVTTPYHGYLKNLALSLFNKWDFHHTSLWTGGHVKFWSRTTLQTLFENNGFKVTGFAGVGRVPYLWKSMIMVAQKSD